MTTNKTGRSGSGRGRGKAQASLALIDAITYILMEIQPATVRAVCYRLFIEKLIPSMSKANTNRVGRLMVWAREQGLVQWEWVVDETREAECVATWSDPQSIIDAAVRQYRRDNWQSQDAQVEVWSEKGTIRGTLAPVLKEYGVTFRVMHGYGSATSIHDIAVETAASDKWLTVLYVGDWDPSGLQMSEIDLPTRLDRYGGEATIVRVALNANDVAPDTDLPWFEAESKAKDPRHKWFVENYGNRCWEVDALSPVILRQRVEMEIMNLLDMEAWNHAIEIETAERESMANVLSTWASIYGQASKCSPGGNHGA
jgi:hypothetical protein